MGLPLERSVRDASIRFICLLGVGCCVLLVGCNSGKQLQGDLYQRELRLQEDEIYRLEDHVEEYQAIVRGYRCEVADLRHELAAAHSQPQLAPAPVLAAPVLAPIEGPEFFSSGTTARKEPTPAGEIDIKPFKAPETDSVPKLKTPSDVKPLKFRPAPDAPEAPPFTPGADANRLDHAASLALHEEANSPAHKKSKANAAAAEVMLTDDDTPPLPFPTTKALPIAESQAQVLMDVLMNFAPYEETVLTDPVEIEMVPRQAPHKTIVDETTVRNEPITPLLKLAAVDSVQVDLQNGPKESTGEPTLVARLSPLSSGEPAYFEGEASVLIADMSKSDSRRRLGRWDFSTDEVAQSWAEDSTQLELPLLLPVELVSKMPTDRPLRLWVRLVDSRGRKTLHSMDVDFVNHPWRLAETRSLETIQARPIEMATLPLRRLPIEIAEGNAEGNAEGDAEGDAEPSEGATEERVVQSEPAIANQSVWKRAVLHRSNARSTPKRDDAVTPAAYLTGHK